MDSAKKEVEMLAKHPGWYARRYVCYILEERPELAISATLNRLRNDPHPLVVERGKLIK